MGAAQDITTPTSDIRVGRRIHCRLYGGRNGTIVAVDGTPNQGNSRSMMGGAFMVVSGPEAHIDVVWDDGATSKRVPECIATGVQWHFVDEQDRTPAEVEQAEAFAKDTAEKAEAQRKAENDAFDREVQAYREDERFSHFEQTSADGKYSRDRDNMTARNIRKHLKRTFPGVKFSVRKRSFDALGINWSREAETDEINQKTVTEAVSMFKTGSFNAMEDYHSSNSSAFNEAFGGFDFIFCQRSI
jgi:macrodomain Ter protein organizer (MatP/YcbG family)